MSRSPGRGGPSALGRWNRLVAKSNAASNAVGSSGPSKACATYAHWRKRAAIAIGTSFGALTKDGVQMHPRDSGENLPVAFRTGLVTIATQFRVESAGPAPGLDKSGR